MTEPLTLSDLVNDYLRPVLGNLPQTFNQATNWLKSDDKKTDKSRTFEATPQEVQQVIKVSMAAINTAKDPDGAEVRGALQAIRSVLETTVAPFTTVASGEKKPVVKPSIPDEVHVHKTPKPNDAKVIDAAKHELAYISNAISGINTYLEQSAKRSIEKTTRKPNLEAKAKLLAEKLTGNKGETFIKVIAGEFGDKNASVGEGLGKSLTKLGSAADIYLNGIMPTDSLIVVAQESLIALERAGKLPKSDTKFDQDVATLTQEVGEFLNAAREAKRATPLQPRK